MQHRLTSLFALGLMLCGMGSMTAQLWAEDSPKEISADQAFEHATEKCTVLMTVESSRLLKDKEIVFLNSRKNYRDEDNFTVVIFRQALGELRKQKIEDPAQHFAGKLIAVTGEIELRSGKPQIIIKDPAQIKIREQKSEE